MNAFAWSEATSLAQAVAQGTTLVADAMLPAAKPGTATVFKAGGVDLLDLLKENLVAPAQLVSLRQLPQLGAIRPDLADGTHLGALVTLAQLAADPGLERQYRALVEAARHAATPQVRQAATLGGNIMQRPHCWYFRNEAFACLKKGGTVCHANLPQAENKFHAVLGNQTCSAVPGSSLSTALVALGAELSITGPQGVRRQLLEEFFVRPETDVHRENNLQPGELITDVRLPVPAAGTASWYIKFGERESYDWAVADVAVVLTTDPAGRCTAARVVLGAAAPVPLRVPAVEQLLVGQKLTEAVARAAAELAMQGATPLEQNAYKVPIFTTIVRRAILRAAGLS